MQWEICYSKASSEMCGRLYKLHEMSFSCPQTGLGRTTSAFRTQKWLPLWIKGEGSDGKDILLRSDMDPYETQNSAMPGVGTDY